MRVFGFVKRAVLVIALSAGILVAGVSAYLRIEQYKFRRRAERLLSDVRELELEKASAAQVKIVVKKWGFEKYQRPDKPCTEDECIYYLQLVPKAVQGHVFADPFHESTAFPLEWLGLRLTVVHVWVRIRGRALRSVSFSVWTLGRGCHEQRQPGCTLMGEAGANWGGSWSTHDQPDVTLKHSLLHPSYLVGTFPELLNVDTGGSPAVVVWAELFPDANAADTSRLLQFDLSCLTRLVSCRNRDLMPTVWAQSVEDIRESPKILTCTPEVSKRVAQLADVIAIVRPRTVELSSPRREGRSPQLRDLEIVNLIRKPEHPRKFARLDVDVDRPEMMTTADTGSPVRPRQEYVLLLQNHSTPSRGWLALYPCGALSSNDANMAMVREAAADGAE